ncbi:MAG TPA: glycosyltransferase [Pyrinomonadaceae bacterium]|nr:glycosyltransferase [Pyrinomonadaceae bacterium]
MSIASEDLEMAVMEPAAKPELRVLQVFSSLSMGGAETWLMALLKYFREEDVLPLRVITDVLLTGGSEDMFDAEAKALGARLFHRHFTRKRTLPFAREFRQILMDGRYHAIHDHQDYSAGLRFAMGLGHLPPVRVAHVHNTSFSVDNYNSSPTRRLTFHAAKRFLAHTATDITSTSREMLTEFGFDSPQFREINRQVVHCGFDVSAFQGTNRLLHQEVAEEFGWPGDVKLILFVGRLDEPVGDGRHRKNPGFALEVAKACIAQDASVRMIMAGSGTDMRRELENRVRGWGLEDRIRLTGIYPDITRLMLGADLFLFPSLAEGLGMVAVEAQAAGLRVLTSEGVPRESMVIPEIVEFHPLEAGVAFWANQSLRLLALERPDAGACNLAVRNSPFSIENSALNLLRIYSGGEAVRE